jgi:flagellar basal body-associated protein FliL
MENRLKLVNILLIVLVVALSLVVFNVVAANQELKQKNANLSNDVEKVEASKTEEKEVFTRTERFLTETLQGGSIDYFTARYRKEVEQTLSENETSQDVDVSETKDLEIYNISVRKQEDTYKVYALYKATLTGVDDEFVNPGDQPLLILMSTITWINEDGELKVDAHDLEPLVSGEQVIQEMAS